MSDYSSELVGDFEAHGDFRRNYGKVVGDSNDDDDRSVPRAVVLGSAGLGFLRLFCSHWPRWRWLDANNLVLISLINSSTVLARTAL